MSVLVHDCLHCGHRQDMHYQGTGNSRCLCCQPWRAESDFQAQPEPRLHETYSVPGHRPEPLYKPRGTRNPMSMHRSDVCGCERCEELYAELTTT